MNFRLVMLIALIGILSISTGVAKANAGFKPVKVGKAAWAGNGCAEESFEVALGVNSVTPGNFKTNAGRVACVLAVPVLVNSGYQIAITNLNFNGSVEGEALLGYRVFFTGQPTYINKSRFNSTQPINYTIQDVASANLNWSVCGRSVNGRINSSLRRVGGSGEVSVGEMGFELVYRRCDEG